MVRGITPELLLAADRHQNGSLETTDRDVDSISEDAIDEGAICNRDTRKFVNLQMDLSVGVVGAGAGQVLRRALRAAYTIKVELAEGANAADHCSVVGKSRTFKI